RFDAAYVGQRQTYLGRLDMAWHGADPAALADAAAVTQVERDIAARHDPLFAQDTATGMMSTSFTHLFAGAVAYSSGYYSYKWAEVLEADVFECFTQHGLYNKQDGARLRDTIYSQGNRRDPADLFRDFM